MRGPRALPATCRSGQLWKALLPRRPAVPGKVLQVKSPARALVAGGASLIGEAAYLGLPGASGQNVLGPSSHPSGGPVVSSRTPAT